MIRSRSRQCIFFRFEKKTPLQIYNIFSMKINWMRLKSLLWLQKQIFESSSTIAIVCLIFNNMEIDGEFVCMIFYFLTKFSSIIKPLFRFKHSFLKIFWTTHTTKTIENVFALSGILSNDENNNMSSCKLDFILLLFNIYTMFNNYRIMLIYIKYKILKTILNELTVYRLTHTERFTLRGGYKNVIKYDVEDRSASEWNAVYLNKNALSYNVLESDDFDNFLVSRDRYDDGNINKLCIICISLVIIKFANKIKNFNR